MAVVNYSIALLNGKAWSGMDVLTFLVQSVATTKSGWNRFKPDLKGRVWKAILSCVNKDGCVIVRTGMRRRRTLDGVRDVASHSYNILIREPDGTTHLVLVTFTDC